jgi:hypothetical protein
MIFVSVSNDQFFAEAYFSIGEDATSSFDEIESVYDEDNDCFICPIFRSEEKRDMFNKEVNTPQTKEIAKLALFLAKLDVSPKDITIHRRLISNRKFEIHFSLTQLPGFHFIYDKLVEQFMFVTHENVLYDIDIENASTKLSRAILAHPKIRLLLITR